MGNPTPCEKDRERDQINVLGSLDTSRRVVQQPTTREALRRVSGLDSGEDTPDPRIQVKARGKQNRPIWPGIHTTLNHAEITSDGKIFLINRSTGQIIASKTDISHALNLKPKDER